MDIVIIHKGFNKYVLYCLKQLKITNKNSNVYLLSDKEYKEYSKYSIFVDINNILSDDAKLFADKYIHLGKSNPSYEMFCMQRWIILRDFMKLYNIKECFYMDSDVLIFSNLDEALLPFDDYKISLISNLALSMYIKDVSILDEFSFFLLNKYTSEIEINKLKEMYYNTDRVKNGVAGSISDMDLSREFFNNKEVGNLYNIVNDSIFDIGLFYGEFEKIVKGRYSLNKIYFENNIPYSNFIYHNNNNKIRFHSLHFLTWTKIFIKDMCNYKNLNYNEYVINIYREFKVFQNKIKKILKS
ncbi:hypothetical protein [Brachyspira pilosicoli]|uniref:hypothetical protein n=1 Tax=Brachyspira pilosicoli TaxID=52584 RepID=UPI0012F6A8C1|nr:hypothetical protein [Brachyspira pilosicoli]